MMELNKLVRKNIRELNSYSTARDEEGERISIYLDANENPFENGVNRYPDPKQRDLKKIISSIYNVPVKNIFAGNGSDEAIDLLFKVFCEPKSDNVLSISPTYGMYKVAAQINDVEFREILLEDDFSMNPEKMITATDSNTKLIFVCSPNNPTGNVIDENAIIHIANNFDGIVVIDEAYCEFSRKPGFVGKIGSHPNIVVLRTLSKAWGMAGLRIGFAIADERIVSFLSSVKYPYNIGSDTLFLAMKYLNRSPESKIDKIISERERVSAQLKNLSGVEKVFPSDANFILVKFKDSSSIYKKLAENGISVRDRSNQPKCDNCLRLTIGLPEENNKLLIVLSGKNLNQDINETGRAFIERRTKETYVSLKMEFNGNSISSIHTSIPFFNHMLEQLAFHSGVSMTLNVNGDLEVDDHHTIEDSAIVIGEAISKALGERKGISRYGFMLPMDDCIAQAAIDLGGRAFLNWDVNFARDSIGGMSTEMFQHFFYSLAIASKSTIYISAKGDNDHHKAESIFKAFARALKMAVKQDDNNSEIPTTKGLL